MNADCEGDIASLGSKQHGDIEGDLFVDCTGFSSLLLGKHYEIPFVSRKDNLFIDSALAVQVPYKSEQQPDRIADDFDSAERRVDLGYRFVVATWRWLRLFERPYFGR